MKRKEKLQQQAVEKNAHLPSFVLRAFIEGMGCEIINDYAYVGSLIVDLRFENLPAEIRKMEK